MKTGHTILKLDPFFSRLWKGRDPFAEVEQLEGEEYRRVKTRRTFRFEADGNGFFCKVHHGVGWKEILKNLLQGKVPVLGAANEFHALNKLADLGVPTMSPAAFGQRGCNPAKQDSFLVTYELKNMTSVEDIAKESEIDSGTKHLLIRKIAESAGKMHAAGINHRDCYICHYLVDKNALTADAKVFVIDLHRAQIRKKVPRHYHIKDVAGLYFSSMDAGLSDRDRLRFAAEYCKHLPECRKNRAFWRNVAGTAEKLYIKEQKRG